MSLGSNLNYGRQTPRSAALSHGIGFPNPTPKMIGSGNLSSLKNSNIGFLGSVSSRAVCVNKPRGDLNLPIKKQSLRGIQIASLQSPDKIGVIELAMTHFLWWQIPVPSILKFLFTVIIILTMAPLSNAAQKDRWFAADKYQHFALSVFYSAGTTVIAHRHFEMSKSKAPVVGFGFTISLGALKEGLDYTSRKGTPSGKDFIWDIAGALAGALAVKLTL
jgi:putative lipoprotein